MNTMTERFRLRGEQKTVLRPGGSSHHVSQEDTLIPRSCTTSFGSTAETLALVTRDYTQLQVIMLSAATQSVAQPVGLVSL